MCFAIPKKIIKVTNGSAVTEDNLIVKTGGMKLFPSNYVRIYGNMVVEKIEKKEALKIRRLIKDSDTNNKTAMRMTRMK